MEMMVRIGAACVMTASGAWGGKMLAGAQERRARALHEAGEAVRRLKVEMLERNMPLKEALAVCGGLFSSAAEEMESGSGPGCAYEQAMDRLSARGGSLDCLTEADRTALRRLFSGLGEGGAQAQRLLLEDAQEELERLEKQAVRKREEQGKLYGSLGALSGIALALIML